MKVLHDVKEKNQIVKQTVDKMSDKKNSCIFEENSLITFARDDKNGKKGTTVRDR